jgi:transposase
VKEFLSQEPAVGAFVLFVGRAKDRLKILYWDSDGFDLGHKRPEDGTFRIPRGLPTPASS